MRPDPATELVEAYLRVNGYFALTDLELHEAEDGGYRTLTDVDVVAVRHPDLPGPAHYRGGPGAVECLLVGEVDPELAVAVDRFDVVVGEVKRGECSFNPALRDPRVLHAVLRRVGDVFGGPVDDLVDELGATGRVLTPTAQVRLVAFGRGGTVTDGVGLHHDHLVGWLNGLLDRHHDLFEISRFSDPVLSLLALAGRIGHGLATPRTDPPPPDPPGT